MDAATSSVRSLTSKRLKQFSELDNDFDNMIFEKSDGGLDLTSFRNSNKASSKSVISLNLADERRQSIRVEDLQLDLTE